MNTRKRHGFTLVEVMISTFIGGLVLAGVMSTFLLLLRTSKRVANYNDMELETARSLETIAREIRMATSITGTLAGADEYTLSKIRLRVPDEETNPSSPTEYQVDYWFRTEANGSKSLVRQEVGTAAVRILTSNIDPLRPHAFTRFDQAPGFAVNDYSTNQIQVSMTIQPNDRGLVAATSERVISAFFVLRNR